MTKKRKQWPPPFKQLVEWARWEADDGLRVERGTSVAAAAAATAATAAAAAAAATGPGEHRREHTHRCHCFAVVLLRWLRNSSLRCPPPWASVRRVAAAKFAVPAP